jgi:hypothetical protein
LVAGAVTGFVLAPSSVSMPVVVVDVVVGVVAVVVAVVVFVVVAGADVDF